MLTKFPFFPILTLKKKFTRQHNFGRFPNQTFVCNNGSQVCLWKYTFFDSLMQKIGPVSKRKKKLKEIIALQYTIRKHI